MDSVTGIIVCANDPLVRAGLAALLGSFGEVIVVAQEDTQILTGSSLLPEDAPAGAIVWDVGWNGVDDAVDLSLIELPTVALVGDEEQAGDAWHAGARGVLWRNTAEEDLVSAILAVGAGFVVLAPTLRGIIRPQSTGPAVPMPDTIPSEDLTNREMEVLDLVAQGLTNKAIGQRLTISEHTVKFHLNSILSKLDAQSRTEAVVKATRWGLISL